MAITGWLQKFLVCKWGLVLFGKISEIQTHHLYLFRSENFQSRRSRHICLVERESTIISCEKQNTNLSIGVLQLSLATLLKFGVKQGFIFDRHSQY